MLRRAFLKALSGLGFVVLAKPQIASAELVKETLEDTFIRIPDWCPKGYIPLLGMKISRKQFPALFQPFRLADGNWFYPLFWGNDYGVLEDGYVQEVIYLERNLDTEGNWIMVDGRSTKEVEGIYINLISIEPMRRPNGILIVPGAVSFGRFKRDEVRKFMETVRV